jgi:hypothetical protein
MSTLPVPDSSVFEIPEKSSVIQHAVIPAQRHADAVGASSENKAAAIRKLRSTNRIASRRWSRDECRSPATT